MELDKNQLTPRLGCTFRMPMVDFGASTGTLEFRKSTLGAAAGSDFDLVSSFLVINCKTHIFRSQF